MKILLLNPPGSKNYLRDYYCSTVSKGKYFYHPVDLLYLSGTLSQEHDVVMLEALGMHLSINDTLKKIQEIKPNIVISLVAAPSFDEDHSFLQQLNNQCPDIRIIGTGDVFREFKKKTFDIMPYLEATCVDFSTEDLLKYLRNQNDLPIQNIIYRKNNELIQGDEIHTNGNFSIPAPKIEIFSKDLYEFPFSVQSPFMTVLSDFGCPYSCSFCPISTLGFKIRTTEEVLQELKHLWAAGYKEVHFRDQTFGVNKARTIELCSKIQKELPKLTWSCFSRVDVLDEERIKAMSSAGCHTTIVGIEFDDDQMLKDLGKNIQKSQMFDAVELCHKAKMNIAGTFILGLPNQSEEDILKTGKLARLLKLDFASFNLATPRLGTSWRKQLIEENKIDEECWKMDTVDGTKAWKENQLSFQKLNHLREQVEKDFYLRPSYILKRFCNIRSLTELQSFLKNGLTIFKKG